MNADAVSLGAGPDLRPRTSDGWGLGATMAFGIHLMLVAALALGVRWKISTPAAVEAEVWATIPKAAAPDMSPPPMAPPPQPVVPPPEAPAEPPKAAEPEPIPDLVVRAKPKKEKKPKKHEPVEVFDTTPPKPLKKVDKKPPEPVKTPPVPAKPVPQTKASAPDDTKANAKAAAEREALRKERLQNMMSELGSLGTPSRSAGPSANYAGRIKARIRPNIIFTGDISGNPSAVVELRCAPDGRIISRKLIEPSGVAAWDKAALDAIDRTEVLPADENGRVPSSMQIVLRPGD